MTVNLNGNVSISPVGQQLRLKRLLLVSLLNITTSCAGKTVKTFAKPNLGNVGHKKHARPTTRVIA